MGARSSKPQQSQQPQQLQTQTQTQSQLQQSLQNEVQNNETKITRSNNKLESIPENIDITDITNTNPDKWIPDDSLFSKFNNVSGLISTITHNRHHLKENQERLERYREDISKNTEFNDNLHKLMNIELKRDMMTLELIVRKESKELTTAENASTEILDEWSKYLDKANQFILDNDLYFIENVNDILSNNGLYLLSKRTYDNFTTNIRDKDGLTKLALLDMCFDIRGSSVKSLNNGASYELALRKKMLLRERADTVKTLDFQAPMTDTIINPKDFHDASKKLLEHNVVVSNLPISDKVKTIMEYEEHPNDFEEIKTLD